MTRPSSRPALVVARSAPLALVFFGALGAALWWLWSVLGAARPGLMATAAVVLVVLGMTLHELGHAAAALRLGEQWTSFHVTGAGFSVRFHFDSRSYVAQALISVAGPGAGIVWDLALGSLSWALWGPVWSPLLAAAGMGLMLNLSNLLPLGLNADGTKLARALWGCVRGRGREPFPLPLHSTLAEGR